MEQVLFNLENGEYEVFRLVGDTAEQSADNAEVARLKKGMSDMAPLRRKIPDRGFGLHAGPIRSDSYPEQG